SALRTGYPRSRIHAIEPSVRRTRYSCSNTSPSCPVTLAVTRALSSGWTRSRNDFGSAYRLSHDRPQTRSYDGLTYRTRLRSKVAIQPTSLIVSVITRSRSSASSGSIPSSLHDQRGHHALEHDALGELTAERLDGGTGQTFGAFRILDRLALE